MFYQLCTCVDAYSCWSHRLSQLHAPNVACLPYIAGSVGPTGNHHNAANQVSWTGEQGMSAIKFFNTDQANGSHVVWHDSKRGHHLNFRHLVSCGQHQLSKDEFK